MVLLRVRYFIGTTELLNFFFFLMDCEKEISGLGYDN